MKAKKDWEKTKGLGTNQQAQARTNKRMGGPKICTITQGPSSFEYRKEKEKRHFNYYLPFFETMLKQALSPTQGTKWRSLSEKGDYGYVGGRSFGSLCVPVLDPAEIYA
jgi:hypothetical protein